MIRLHLHAYMQVSRGVMTRGTRVPRCIYREGCPQSMMGRGEAGYAIATDALLIRWITDGVQLARYGLQQIFLWWQEETRGLLQGPVPCDTLIPILSQDGDPSDDPRRFLVVVCNIYAIRTPSHPPVSNYFFSLIFGRYLWLTELTSLHHSLRDEVFNKIIVDASEVEQFSQSAVLYLQLEESSTLYVSFSAGDLTF